MSISWWSLPGGFDNREESLFTATGQQEDFPQVCIALVIIIIIIIIKLACSQNTSKRFYPAMGVFNVQFFQLILHQTFDITT